MKKKTIIAFLALLLAIGTMVYAGAYLVETKQIYQEGNTLYEDLRGSVRVSAATDLTAQHRQADQSNTPLGIPKPEISFEALRSINKDAVAWLFSPNTVIDYPVMRADDYSYYLEHLPDGTKNANGSLFIDYNCASDFSDQLTVIYGHHMKSGSMFGSLTKYKNQRYYEEHPFLYLYTEKENYRIELIYGFVIDAEQWREQAFMYEANVEKLLAYAADNTTFKSGVKYEEADRAAALSTCSYEFDDARYVVIGILR